MKKITLKKNTIYYLTLTLLLFSVSFSTYSFFKQKEEISYLNGQISNLNEIISNGYNSVDIDSENEEKETVDCDILGLRKENKERNIYFKKLEIVTSQGSSDISDSIYLISDVDENLCKYNLTPAILKALNRDSLDWAEYRNVIYLPNQNSIVLNYQNTIVKINLDKESKAEVLISNQTKISGPLGYSVSGPFPINLFDVPDTSIADAFIVYGTLEGGCEFDNCAKLAKEQEDKYCSNNLLGVWTFDGFSGKNSFINSCDISLM